MWPSGLRRQTQDLLGVTPHEFKSRRVHTFYTLLLVNLTLVVFNFATMVMTKSFISNITYRTQQLSLLTINDCSRSTRTTVRARLTLRNSSSKWIKSSDARLNCVTTSLRTQQTLSLAKSTSTFAHLTMKNRMYRLQ
jgi:hypothetical protein